MARYGQVRRALGGRKANRPFQHNRFFSMQTFIKPRKHLFVDPKIQGPLILRVVLYWIACVITIALLTLCWHLLTGDKQPFRDHLSGMWSHSGPAFIASLALLPLVVIDILGFSNRLVGPLLRLRRGMRQLARGQRVEKLAFRDRDLWQECADDFNAVLDRFQNADPSVQANSPECPSRENEEELLPLR